MEEILSYLSKELEKYDYPPLDLALFHYIIINKDKIERKMKELNLEDFELVPNDDGGLSLFLFNEDGDMRSICSYFSEADPDLIIINDDLLGTNVLLYCPKLTE